MADSAGLRSCAACSSSSKHARSARADASQVKSAARSRARRAIAWPLVVVAQERTNHAGHRAHVGRIEVNARIAHHFRQRARATRNDRRAAGHRLDGRQTESLHERRRDQRIGPAVKKHEIFIWNKSRHDHAIIKMMSLDGRADLGDVGVKDVVYIAGEHEQDVVGRSLGEGFDQANQVLVRAQAADIEQIAGRRRDRETLEDRAGLRLVGSRAGRSGRGLR